MSLFPGPVLFDHYGIVGTADWPGIHVKGVPAQNTMEAQGRVALPAGEWTLTNVGATSGLWSTIRGSDNTNIAVAWSNPATFTLDKAETVTCYVCTLKGAALDNTIIPLLTGHARRA